MLVIRKATAADATLIVDMIRELADFEHELDEVNVTPQDLLRDGFGANPEFSRFCCGLGRSAGSVRTLFLYLLDVGRPSQLVRRRPICASPVSMQGDWQGALAIHGCNRARAQLLRYALGSAGLELDCHRLLSFAWGKHWQSVAAGAAHGASLRGACVARTTQLMGTEIRPFHVCLRGWVLKRFATVVGRD
jgi:hypothetical protein